MNLREIRRKQIKDAVDRMKKANAMRERDVKTKQPNEDMVTLGELMNLWPKRKDRDEYDIRGT